MSERKKKMKPRSKIKLAVDLLMTLSLLFLMGYQLWWETAHEWAGTGMCVLFIAHHLLNLAWYRNLFRGKYTVIRVLNSVVDLALLAVMICLMASGIIMSRHVFAFLPITGGMGTARLVHMAACYWGFVLMALHLGFHWGMMMTRTRNISGVTKPSGIRRVIFLISGIVIAGYGLYVFVTRDLVTYMFLRTQFVFLDYSESPISFYIDYLAMMGLFIWIAHYLSVSLKKYGKKRTRAGGKKVVSTLITAITVMSVLAGCSQATENPAEDPSGEIPAQTEDNTEGNIQEEASGASADISGTDSIGNTSESPAVYMTTDISSEGLIAVYESLQASPKGNIAVKLSTGEPGSNYLRTDLIGDLVQSFDDPTIVECNTAYGGSRANTAMHYQVAEDHGYTEIADVDIMDENGSMTLPVTGGTNLEENYVGSHFADYDYYVVLSHFKGHSMAGYGGAIKNISIGIASAEGKSHIHSGGTGGSMWGGDQDAFLESMAEAGKPVADYLDGNILYINVMNRLSVDCDCDGNPAEPDMHDIGILASYDPVALDQACIDLVYSAEDGDSLVERIESRNGLHTLEHAEDIGLGSRTYELVNIDG